jgi:hypothetical protein
MFGPQFRLRSFDELEPTERETVLRLLLEALITENIAYLRVHPDTPWLYQSGVTYEEEEGERDDWTDIAETRALGVGDCEDLASWRIAELRVRAREAAAIPYVSARIVGGNRTVFHVAVRRADGRIEDPSRVLGMR